MITDQPAPVRTSAAVAPAGPVPTMTASQSGTAAHLVVGVAARLTVAGELDGIPSREGGVAAVFGRPVRAFAGVRVEERAELALRAESPILLGGVDLGEVGAERGDAFAIDLLPAARRAVELAFGDPERSLDARSPRELFVAGERKELLERRVAAGASAEGSTGEDPRRVEGERTEQAVDVVGYPERGAARMGVERRDEKVGRDREHRVLVRAEKSQQGGETT